MLSSRAERGTFARTRSEIDAFVGDRLAFGHVEAAGKNRALAGRRAGILHDQDLAAGLGAEIAFEMRIGVEQHRARRAELAVDGEFALQDVPDLREAVIMLGMMCAGLQPKNAGVGLGGPLRPRMEQHLAGLARPADRLPFDIVDVAHVIGQMIPARGLAPGDEACVRLRRIGDVLAHAGVSCAAAGEERRHQSGASDESAGLATVISTCALPRPAFSARCGCWESMRMPSPACSRYRASPT